MSLCWQNKTTTTKIYKFTTKKTITCIILITNQIYPQTCKSSRQRCRESNSSREIHLYWKNMKNSWLHAQDEQANHIQSGQKNIYLIRQALRCKITCLIHINGLNCFPTGKYYRMVLVFWFAFSKFWISRKLNWIYFLHVDNLLEKNNRKPIPLKWFIKYNYCQNTSLYPE